MKKAQNPDLLLEMLQKHEVVLGQLYRKFGQLYQTLESFWNELAIEEARHAQCLKSLRELIKTDPDILIVERFSTDAIRFSIDSIEKLIQRAGEHGLTAVKALSIAMNLEEALLEKKFFEVLAGDSEEIQSTLELLSSETKVHYERLRSVFLEHKSKTHLD